MKRQIKCVVVLGSMSPLGDDSYIYPTHTDETPSIHYCGPLVLIVAVFT